MIPDGKLLSSELIPTPSSSLSMAKRSLSSEEFAVFQAVRLYKISYASQGLKIYGWLTVPPESGKPMPSILFNRGGSGPRGALTAQGAMAFLGLYSAWGYVGIATNYRGIGDSDGGAESWGEFDVIDAMNLLPLLDSLPYTDKDRIGVVGGSRGGLVTFLMLKETSRFRAAVTFGAPTSIHEEKHDAYIRRMMSKHLADDTIEQVEAERRSVVLWSDKLCSTTPLLVLHGAGDRRVTPSHALQLAQKLQEHNHPYKLIIYDNADHVLAGRRMESNSDVKWWLNNYVFKKSQLPKTGPHGA